MQKNQYNYFYFFFNDIGLTSSSEVAANVKMIDVKLIKKICYKINFPSLLKKLLSKFVRSIEKEKVIHFEG